MLKRDAWARAGAVVVGCMTTIGCAAEDEDPSAQEDEEAVYGASAEDQPGLDPQTSRGEACRYACVAAGAAGCAAVSAICATTTTFTIGGATIPCAWATIAACAAEAVGVRVCEERCPP